jgi:phosphosulfolactate synthase
MKFALHHLPERPSKPRETGITMVMDKGLSVREAEDMIEVCGNYIDVIKLGWATGYISPHLKRKLKVYRDAKIPYYFGGTLFEAFVIRGQFDDYRKMIDHYKAPYAEVSDGSITMTTEDKLNYIRTLAKDVTVLSEVGSKDANVEMAPSRWVEMMKQELEAGAYKVIAEARESGTAGVFQKSGEVKEGITDLIMKHIDQTKVLWEAPNKMQQVYFIKKIGSNVNLGNIAPSEIIPLETLRLGLRGDTFHDFLPKK